MLNPFKVGDILVCIWGYGQTNVNFYKVSRISKQSIWLRGIDKFGVDKNGKPKKYSYQDGEGLTMPNPDKEILVRGARFRRNNINDKVAEFKKIVQKRCKGGDPCVTMNSFSFAFKWDGKPVRESWYY